MAIDDQQLTARSASDLLVDWDHSYRRREQMQAGASVGRKSSNNDRCTRSLKRSRKSVAFLPTVRCLEIPTKGEMSQEEIDATWFTNEEMKISKENMKQSVLQLRQAHKLRKNGAPIASPETDDVCFRGLEHFASSRVLRQRQDHNAAVVDAVLAAQDKGKDEHEIAAASARISAEARERALSLAMLDNTSVSVSSVLTRPSRRHQQILPTTTTNFKLSSNLLKTATRALPEPLQPESSMAKGSFPIAGTISLLQ